MLATIKKAEEGYVARFERHFNHSIEEVWSYLTDNEKIKKWFPELQIEKLSKDGIIKFEMPNGTFEVMKILNLEEFSTLEFTWGLNKVRIELYPDKDGCLLFLIENIHIITEQTAKDLAGWHVCLDVINAFLDEDSIKPSEKDWNKWYSKYIHIIYEEFDK